MGETFALWIRAETEADAAARGRAWADAEPRWSFVRVVSVEPSDGFFGVWTVTVEADPIAGVPMTLGLVG